VHTPEHVHSKCDYGEFPLCFAAAVGNEQICNQLFDHYIRRVDRMIALSRALKGKAGNLREIDSRLFTQVEASPGRLDFLGGQLFTRQQVQDFDREMTAWIHNQRREWIDDMLHNLLLLLEAEAPCGAEVLRLVDAWAGDYDRGDKADPEDGCNLKKLLMHLVGAALCVLLHKSELGADFNLRTALWSFTDLQSETIRHTLSKVLLLLTF
jgi:hypothetical protein